MNQMQKNFAISILSVIGMQQSGFIDPSNTAAMVLAPVFWFLAIMTTLASMDEYVRTKRRERKEREANERMLYGEN